MALVSALSADKDYYWCMSTSCKSGQIHEDADAGPIMSCNNCGFKTCVVHQVAFHSGETCSQYDERMNQLRAEVQGESQDQSAPGGKRKRDDSELADLGPHALAILAAVDRMSLDPTSSLGNRSVQRHKRAKKQRRLEEERREEEEEKAQAKLRLEEEMANEKALARDQKRNKCIACPGEGCGHLVYKRGGCDHITCKIYHTVALQTTDRRSPYRHPMWNGVLLPLRRVVHRHPSRGQFGARHDLPPLSVGSTTSRKAWRKRWLNASRR
jgi:IBR domain, a half RING-finger domain